MFVVTNNGNVRTFGDAPGLVLLPGVNRVKDEVWDKLTKNAQVKRLVGVGELAAKKAKDDLESLKALKTGDAVKLVRDTLDRSLLAQWRATEQRAAVQLVLDEQLAAVTLTAEEREAPPAEEHPEGVAA